MRARRRARKQHHVIKRYRGRLFVAEDRHRGGVADENRIDAGGVRKPRARRVVRRDHRDLLMLVLERGQIGWCQFHDADYPLAASGALSMRRVAPTRAAITSVGRPSKSATVT